MNTTLFWILLAFLMCSLLTSSSAFTPGAGRQRMGKREKEMELSDDQDYIKAFCNKVRPCPNDYRRESFLHAAQLAKDRDF